MESVQITMLSYSFVLFNVCYCVLLHVKLPHIIMDAVLLAIFYPLYLYGIQVYYC